MEDRLDPIFRPRSIAVIGASRTQGKIGHTLMKNLIVNEFQGKLFPVNPKADSVWGVKAYPTILDVPDPVDLAIITIPAEIALGAVEQCAAKGVKGLVVITAGFREIGPAGEAREDRLREVCRAHGIALVGPNCMGVINTHPDVRMDATFAPTPPLRGPVSFLSQSGALGVAILEHARNLNLGFSMFASLGNKADVSGNDLLEAWEKDPDTKVVLMYLENFGNPKNFVRIARRATKRKPVVAVKAGRTEAGGRATASHTGSLGGSDVAAEAVFTQTGVLRADSIEELFDAAMAFSKQPLPKGKRVAIVSDAGGPAIMCTDFLIQHGMELATHSPGFVHLVENNIPSYLFPEDAAKTVSTMHRYKEYLERDEGVFPRFEVDREAARRVLETANTEGRTRLREAEAMELLQAYGFRTAAIRTAKNAEEAARVAREIGYPVVLKAVGPDLVHKTEYGAVALDLRTGPQVREACARMEKGLQKAGVSWDGFVVQEFVKGGRETILGMTRDRVYGPLLAFGLGGIYVEFLKDVAFGLAPLTDADAMRMIRSIRTYPLLEGVRGETPSDLPALSEALQRLSLLVTDFDEIAEVDLNPVAALEKGQGYKVLDARIIL